MATSSIPVTPGSGKNVATYSVSEDAVTKEVQRVVASNSSGVEAGTLANPTYSAVTQNVLTAPGNTSSANLNSGNSYTFTGTAESTLGVNSIQVSLFADKNCLVKVQQSPNNSPNWDISDSYNYTANDNFGITVQAVGAYFRVIVTTISLTTTTFRLTSILCPVVEALPRSLDANGNLKVTLQKDIFGNPIENSTLGEMLTVDRNRLVGTLFTGNTIDSNFWNTLSSVGTVTQAGGNLTITSGTANGNFASIWSVRRARFVTGSSNKWRAHFRMGDTGTANVKKRGGVAAISNYLFTVSGSPTVVAGNVYTNNSQEFTVGIAGTGVSTVSMVGTGAPAASGTLIQIVGSGGNLTFTSVATQAVPVDGAYFELDGTTFSVVTCKGGSETRVSSGSFNGQYGYTFALNTNNGVFEIAYGNGSVTFIANQVPIHKVTASSGTWANALTFNAFADVTNSGASSAVSMFSRAMNITRLGSLTTATAWKYQPGNVTAEILKRGAGTLHTVVNNDSTGSIILYDGATAINPIAALDCTKVFGPVTYNLDFSNGLCYTTAGGPKVTIVYE